MFITTWVCAEYKTSFTLQEAPAEAPQPAAEVQVNGRKLLTAGVYVQWSSDPLIIPHNHFQSSFFYIICKDEFLFAQIQSEVGPQAAAAAQVEAPVVAVQVNEQEVLRNINSSFSSLCRHLWHNVATVFDDFLHSS